jgi:hypothetical protein
MIPPSLAHFRHFKYTAGMAPEDENASRPLWALTAPRAWALAGVLALVAACAAGTIGAWPSSTNPAIPDAPGPGAGAAAVAFAAVGGGVLAALYILAACGIGRGVVRALRPVSPASRELEFGAGLAAMLVLSHLLASIGALTPLTAWGVVLIGVVLWGASFARPVKTAIGSSATAAWWWLPALPAAAVLLAAASNPPGLLWASEAGGYDTVSYHLQLVREWLAAGRLSPLDHNIYSYLPSYAEGAFLHLAHLAVPIRSLLGPDVTASVGGLAETAILGAAWLHALVAIGAAVGLARVASTILTDGREFAALAGAALLATPWVVVVGSLAYNDMFVVALGAGCVLAAVSPGLSASARGVLIGLMGSAAVGAKPTAFFLLAPLVLAAIVLPKLVTTRGDWMRLIVACAVVGSLAGAPWLIRNAAASGNPVFPFAGSVFGDGPWTAEQHARYKSAHRFDGSVSDRFAAALALPTAGAGDPKAHGLGGQPRGLFHNQWSILFPIGIIGLGLGLAAARTRRASATMLVALAAQLGAWLALTHVQSRFLLPCVIPLALGVALGLEALRTLLGGTRGARLATLSLGAVCVAWLALRTVLIFSSECGGRPNVLLAFGVDGLTGEPLIHELSHVPAEMRERVFSGLPSPQMFVNTGGLDDFIPPSGPTAIYLLGDATPFYFTNPRVPVVYHTTYDRPPWATSDPAASSNPDAWARALHDRGVRFVLVNNAELARLHDSGWYDPAVTPTLVDQFVREHGRVIVRWPHRGQDLYMLKEPRPAAPPPAWTGSAGRYCSSS